MIKNFRFRSGIGLGFAMLFIFNIGLLVAAVIATNHLLAACAIVLSCIQYYLHNRFGQNSGTIKNYPFKYLLKDVFSFIPQKITRLLFTSHKINSTLTEKERVLLARRLKNVGTAVVEDNLLNAHDPGFEYLQTHPAFMQLNPLNLRVEIGTTECHRPYSLSVFNFGAMDRDDLHKKGVHAVSQAANMCNCAVNPGAKGLTPELVRGGGDIIWQMSYNDIALRNPDRSFNETLIKSITGKPYVKMIEVKFHSDQGTAPQMALSEFAICSLIKKLRLWSGGKPVGIHLLNPGKEVIGLLGKSMVSSGICFDFISIEESRVRNFLLHKASEQRFFEAVFTAKSLVRNYGLQTKIIATGVIVTEYDILRLAALGADACFNAVGTLMADGLIKRQLASRVGSQSIRMANFHRNTTEATRALMQRCGYEKLSEADPADFFRRINALEVIPLSDIFCQTGREKYIAQYLHLN